MNLAVLLLALNASSASLPTDALALPPVRQATGYSCGAAAFLSVLRYWGVYDGAESGLYAELGTTPKDGTEPPSLARAAKARGLRARLREGLSVRDLRRALARGETAIVDIQAWKTAGSTIAWREDWDDGHYVVLAGLDERNAYFMDPALDSGYGWVPISELESRWHDFEDRHGTVRRYIRSAVFIDGARPHRNSSLRSGTTCVRIE